jgi:autotransporter-associated beta strand protein
MRHMTIKLVSLLRPWTVVLCLTGMIANFASPALAQDSTWDNGSSNFQWNTTSTNWNNGASWTNGHGAIFGAAGVGTINMGGPISVNSLNFTTNGYTINGTGPMTFVNGTSTQTTGVVNVAAGATATINTPIVNGVGFQKIGAGILELGGSGNSFTGQFPMTGNGSLQANVIIGPAPSGTNPTGGTLRLLNANVLPASTNVAIGPGFLDIGNHTVTLNQLIFSNQNPSAPWNSALMANNGVIGSGTLRLNGAIWVNGVSVGVGNNSGNSIAANLDLAGNPQLVRVGSGGSIMLNQGVMFTGVISDSVGGGSLIKSLGFNLSTGSIGSVDGISLFANNTYTGASIFNSGTSVATGTNASTSIVMAGIGGPGGSVFSLQGANGSFLSATNISAVGSGTFQIDNNASLGASGNNQPNIPAAQNNNRIADNATVTLRDGSFVYRGFTGASASENYGSLNVTGGHSSLTLTPNGGGSVNLIAAGDLVLNPRATLQITATGTGNTLGGNAKALFGGVPTADSTGIIRRVIGGTGVTPSDFMVYDATDGVKAFTGYSTDFSTPGTNVALTSAATAPTVTINALKTTGTFNTTIGAGDLLTVSSGMLLSASGTQTMAGAGTLNFGNSAGVTFGTSVINTAVTGTAGLIHATGTLTLAGDLSGLTGSLDVNSTGTTNLNTNSFTGDIQVRRGTLSIGVNQSGSGLGTILLGVPENSANLIHGTPTLTYAATVTQINQNIVADNGGIDLYGVLPTDTLTARISPANYTADRNFNGNVLLNSDLAIWGGTATGAGNDKSIIFNGDVSGNARMLIRNGRVVFGGSSSWSNAGGMLLGESGNTAQISFFGTGTGNGSVTMNGGNSNLLRYNNNSSFGGGVITIRNASGSSAPRIVPTANSTLSNQINLNGDAIVDVGTGIIATWAGPLTGNAVLNKNDGTGVLILTSNSNTHTGSININAGTFLVNSVVAASANGISVANGATLGGVGVINRNVTANGKLAPGNSPGLLTINGNLNFSSAGIFEAELFGNTVGSAYDQLVINGLVNLNSANLSLNVDFTPSPSDIFFILANDGIDPISGIFNGLTEGTTFSFGNGFSAQITYLADASTSSLTGGNDVALFGVAIPEPGSLLVLGLLTIGLIGRRRKPQ